MLAIRKVFGSRINTIDVDQLTSDKPDDERGAAAAFERGGAIDSALRGNGKFVRKSKGIRLDGANIPPFVPPDEMPRLH